MTNLKIEDISNLKNFNKLQIITLNNNAIVDVTIFNGQNFPNLLRLDLS